MPSQIDGSQSMSLEQSSDPCSEQSSLKHKVEDGSSAVPSVSITKSTESGPLSPDPSVHSFHDVDPPLNYAAVTAAAARNSRKTVVNTKKQLHSALLSLLQDINPSSIVSMDSSSSDNDDSDDSESGDEFSELNDSKSSKKKTKKQRKSGLTRSIMKAKNALMDGLKQRQNQAEQRMKLKSLQFQTAFKKQVRKSVIGDETVSITRHLQQPTQVKLLDKICFTWSVCHMLMTEYLFLNQSSDLIHVSFEQYYCTMLSILMIFRYVTYHSRHWQYFMIDFCYFVNLLTLLHITLWPQCLWLFDALWVLNIGPTLFAIFVWRNSMVFHSTDKMTSLFIHTMPPLYSMYLRFKREESPYFYLSQRKELSLNEWLVYPTILYSIWQILYLIKTEIIDADFLEQHKDFITSLRWLSDSKTGLTPYVLKLCRKLGLFGKDEEFDWKSMKTKFVFVMTNFVYYLVMVLPTRVMYSRKYLSLGIFVAALVCSMFNGANYYIEVFSNRYNKMLDDRKQKVESQYENIDENLDRIFDRVWYQIYADQSRNHSMMNQSDPNKETKQKNQNQSDINEE